MPFIASHVHVFVFRCEDIRSSLQIHRIFTHIFQECYTVIQVTVRLPGGCEAILTAMGILDRYQTTTIQSKACGVLCMDIRSTENKIRKLLIKNVCQEKPILQNCDIVNYQGPQKLHNNT